MTFNQASFNIKRGGGGGGVGGEGSLKGIPQSALFAGYRKNAESVSTFLQLLVKIFGTENSFPAWKVIDTSEKQLPVYTYVK